MVKRKDLVDIADKDYAKRQGEFMQCQDCGEEIGGTQGDFWSLQMNYVLRCPECNSENLAIVKVTGVITIIRS